MSVASCILATPCLRLSYLALVLCARQVDVVAGGYQVAARLATSSNVPPAKSEVTLLLPPQNANYAGNTRKAVYGLCVACVYSSSRVFGHVGNGQKLFASASHWGYYAEQYRLTAVEGATYLPLTSPSPRHKIRVGRLRCSQFLRSLS